MKLFLSFLTETIFYYAFFSEDDELKESKLFDKGFHFFLALILQNLQNLVQIGQNIHQTILDFNRGFVLPK